MKVLHVNVFVNTRTKTYTGNMPLGMIQQMNYFVETIFQFVEKRSMARNNSLVLYGTGRL